MNFKIESSFLDITNYPLVEKHFEKMASLGWMIHKVPMASLLIYKKINPKELDFSISPYEVETAFTVKSKEELEEFQSVCESVGWNYGMKANNLHVYFKKAGTEAVDISTDVEDEFNTIERIAKKQLISSYISIPVYLYFAWSILGGMFSDIQTLQNGMVQILAPIIPIFFISIIYQIIRIRKFLTINRKNMELGDPLEYVDSKFYIEKGTSLTYLIFLILFIAYTFYAALVLNSTTILIAFVPVFIGLTIGIFYRTFIKPAKKSIKYKKVFLGLALVMSTFASISITFISINAYSMDSNNHDIAGYKVLSANDFKEEPTEDEGDLMRNTSFLIPTSYTYWSWPKGNISVKTEYSNTLTEGVAKNLVARYIKQAEKSVENRMSWEIEILIEEDIYDYSLEHNGITEEEFDGFSVKPIKEAKKEAIKIAKEKAIIRDHENLWNLDEVYFLHYNKTEVVIRKDKEVFYLEGRDFTDPKVIAIIKKSLEL